MAGKHEVPDDLEVARDDGEVERRVLVLGAAVEVLRHVDELHSKV